MDAPYDTLFGVVAPAGTPAAVIAKLNAAINEGLRSPEMRASLRQARHRADHHDAAGVRGHHRGGGPKWADAVRTTGVKVD